jgi:mycofactocin precursor
VAALFLYKQPLHHPARFLILRHPLRNTGVLKFGISIAKGIGNASLPVRISDKERRIPMESKQCLNEESPQILDEIAVEELAIDGICGVY